MPQEDGNANVSFEGNRFAWRMMLLMCLGWAIVSACSSTPLFPTSILVYYREPFQFSEYSANLDPNHLDPDPSNQNLLISPSAAGPISYFQIYCIVNQTGGDFTFDPAKVSMVVASVDPGQVNCATSPTPSCSVGGWLASGPTPAQPLTIPGDGQWSNSHLAASQYFVPRNSKATLIPSSGQNPFAFVSLPGTSFSDNAGIYHRLQYQSTPGQQVSMLPQGNMPPPYFSGQNYTATYIDFVNAKAQSDNRSFPPLTCS